MRGHRVYFQREGKTSSVEHLETESNNPVLEIKKFKPTSTNLIVLIEV